jgi:hypothetical protein
VTRSGRAYGMEIILCYASAYGTQLLGDYPMRIFRNTAILAGAATVLAAAGGANADVVISSAATSNVTCSGGVCAPTAKNAVLNVADLENLLASGNVKVTTSGSGVQANNLEIDAPLSWSGSDTLALDAFQSVLVQRPVSIAGQGGLSIVTNDGGTQGYFGFRAKGHVTFSSLASPLVVNGASYTLEGDIKSLAAAVAANSAGNYALANDFDASKDGTYQNSPIPTEFSGNFEGLGNTISNLSLSGTGDFFSPVGLFAELALDNQPGGSVENISLHNVSIGGNGIYVGGLVGINTGTVSGAFVDGTAESDSQNGTDLALLVSINGGTITRSGAMGSVTTEENGVAGGLVSGNTGLIVQSYANCKVSVSVEGSDSGVLAGENVGISGEINTGSIVQSYAMGSAENSFGSYLGGLVGDNAEYSTIAQSYSTGALKDVGRKDQDAGGLIGVDNSPAGNNSSDYWDLSTSRIKSPKKGAGTPKKDPGITGLTTQQFQSGLPKGFDPTVWAENPKINNGRPYLIANPPK